MLNPGLCAALLLGACVCGAPTATAAVDGEQLDAVAARLSAASAARDGERRRSALEELVALGDPDGVGVLVGEYALASRALRRARAEQLEKRYRLERKLVVREEMKVRAELDAGFADDVEKAGREIAELEHEIQRAAGVELAQSAALVDLASGARGLFGRFGPHKRRKLTGNVWKELEDGLELARVEAPEPADGAPSGSGGGGRRRGPSDSERRRGERQRLTRERIGAVELLGDVGDAGTAVRMQRLVERTQAERARLERELPELEADVRKLDERLQRMLEDPARYGGRKALQAEQQTYYAKSRAASDLRNAVHLLGFISDAAVEAGAKSLARESDADVARSIQALVRAQRRGKGGARRLTLDMLARTESPAVRAALRELLTREKEPLARAEMIDGLARAGDRTLVHELLARHLVDASWHVRSRAAAALATLRVKDAIGVLIERLDVERGRLRTDVQVALESLTGQRFGTRTDLWRHWWRDNSATYEVPADPVLTDAETAAREAAGVSFFGIRTLSERVLFVIDTSGSMSFPMALRSRSRSPGRSGETRLSVARRELVTALGGIPDGGVFNIVIFASDVRVWQRQLVTMDVDTRSEAVAFVQSLEAVGGTNIYGALSIALDVAGAEGGDDWTRPEVDTLFLLSDGKAEAGVTTDSDEILRFVRERNAAAGIVVHAIGISQEQDVYLMRSLAEQNGGTYAAR